MAWKETAKQFVPPIGRRVILESPLGRWMRARELGKGPFMRWWRSASGQAALPAPLAAMIDHFVATDQSNEMSMFWWFLAKRNIEQLRTAGYENFKQTVARNYYTWVGDDANWLLSKVDIAETVARFADKPVPAGEIFRKHSHFTVKEALPFNLNTLLMYFALGAPKLIDEPPQGNPPGIRLDGRVITQDLMNSYLDYETVRRCCDLENLRVVLELGAGYGRSAHYILTHHPQLAYVVLDIPPALYICQRYLAEVFPDKPVLEFSPANSREAIAAAIEKQAMIFITPDQVALLGHKAVDLWVAIDNMHAMTVSQVATYLGQADRVAKAFYFTHWPGMKMPFEEYVHDIPNWPIPKSWKMTLREETTIPSCYVNTFYEIQ
jgi:putative sugar O-methyltransferase